MNQRPEDFKLVSKPGKHGFDLYEAARHVEPPQGFENLDLMDPFEAFVGPFFTRTSLGPPLEVSDTPVELAFQIDDRHVNSNGICHGGMFATFADATQGLLAWRACGGPCVTLSMQTNFLRPGRHGDWVFTKPKLVRRTSTIIFVEAIYEVDGEAVSSATSLWKVLKQG